MSTDWNALLTKNTINGYADSFFVFFFSGAQLYTTISKVMFVKKKLYNRWN